MAVEHFKTCRSNYPEKPKGEPAQMLVTIDIGDGEKIRQCVDCGAFELFVEHFESLKK